jgi:hypothetical protein
MPGEDRGLPNRESKLLGSTPGITPIKNRAGAEQIPSVSHFPAIFSIVAFCCVLNCVWEAIILACRQLQGGRFWGLALVWLGAVMIDFAHH